MSEHRAATVIRETLSGYFERCQAVIERYGGTVEKYIGDAVMAVWGTPVAREDDAERAVRAALALMRAVAAFGAEAGLPALSVRAGVLTGSVSAKVGTTREGMVVGDPVNTASRLQSIAAPGTVLVDDVTRRATEAAIAYEDAGIHEIRGRDQPVHAWTALRVVAGAGGARRGVGVEAPFVGRERELRALVEACEQTIRDGRARRVTVVGEAGAGKSRLLGEFFKDLDGLERTHWWHQGRCLSYGDGVAYSALAEMVRARAGIVEEESPATAREKLRAAVEEHVPDEHGRRMVQPRLAHLLRLEERAEADRADLFSGWRLFFERMAATRAVILVFEDLQWADSGMLDFIDYILEWSAEFPILVVALGRPELHERRPAWQPLVLEPLDPESVAELLDGLVPGLPRELVIDIAGRAEGIPLYAVETIRMLQDRGLVVVDGDRYVVTGDVSDLDVPETLQALLASRLDGLEAAERSALQNAAVLGRSFTAAGLAALSGRVESEVTGTLDGLVAKQVLSRDDDPRSPNRGQYAFLQELLRTVAYGTLARRTRKTLHVAAAQHLERAWPGGREEIAEVLASHYLEAIRADPDADDVTALRASARALAEPFLTLDDPGADKVVRAEALAELATAHLLGGDPEAAGPLLDEALTTLELQRAWPALATALIGQAIHLSMRHRVLEADAILRLALSLAEAHDLPAVALRARHNLAGLALGQDRLADTIREVEPGLVLARERGDQSYERILLAQSLMPLVGLGRWDDAAPIGAALISGERDLPAIWAATCCAQIAGARGDDDTLDRCRAIAAHDWSSTHSDARAPVMLLGARVALERGAVARGARPRPAGPRPSVLAG